MTKWKVAWLGLLVAMIGSRGGTASAMTIVQNGQPRATIVVAAEPNEKVKLAAEDLQTYIEKISGAKLPILTDSENSQGALILVGKSKMTEAMGVEIPSGLTHARKEEGFTIVCKGDRLVLAGNNDGPYHGTEYAVYDFLERLGVRWFMPGEFGEYVPEQSTITVSEMRITEKPDFRIRAGEGDVRWQIRNKQNPTGGDMGFGAADTSVWYLMPPFEERPELYALGPDGKRNRDLGICYSNPETVKAVVNSIKEQFRKNPELNSVGFAPPDGTPTCYCSQCRNLNQGFPNGTSGTWLNNTEEWMAFADKVAGEVYKEFPGRYVTTNGYSNRHMAPQGIRLHPNVSVMFAAIEDCTIHAYDDPKCWQKQAQAEMLKQWAALTDGKVSVYEYLIDMMVSSLTPIPMVHRIRRDIPLMKKWGILGFTICTRTCWGEEGILTKYLRAKLEWDADADVEAIMQDFYSKWYGNAAGPMRAYYDALEKALEDTTLHGHENTFMPEFYTPELLAKLERSIGEAERKAHTDVTRLHVQVDRLIHEHLKAYVAMEAADDQCNYAECIKQAQRMLELRKQINDLTGFPNMMAGEYAYTTEDRIREWQGWLEKMDGTKGELVTALPAEAKFRTDPNKEGFFFGWYKPALEEKQWKPILTTQGWEEQGYQDERGFNYTGLAWYRMKVDIPADAKGKKIVLFVPGDVEEAWCWVNGDYVGHHPLHSVWWRDFSHEFDVTDQVRPGRTNQITFRVLCNEQYFGVSGIFRRVLLYTPKETK